MRGGGYMQVTLHPLLQQLELKLFLTTCLTIIAAIAYV
jgi:hypothetical protein